MNDIDRLFRGIFFYNGNPSISVCCCEFLFNVFIKELFLMSTTRTIPILIVEIAVLLVLGVRLPASSQISMRNRFLYDKILAVLC